MNIQLFPRVLRVPRVAAIGCMFGVAGGLLLRPLQAETPPGGDDIVERDTIRNTLKFTETSGRRLIVDNVEGGIRVTGHSRPDVEFVAYKKTFAESAYRLERARKEITLEFREDGDRIVIFVDTPWRNDDRSGGHRGRDEDGYSVRYDMELKVPAETRITLSTVNDGDIDVTGIRGDFDVSNVNGGIDMRKIDGAGSVSTVNGEIKVSFSATPSDVVSMKTVNGDIEAGFPKPPAANFRFKTMNGEVFTDFDVKAVSLQAEVEEKPGGKKIYSSGNSFMVESAGGGPELSFKTLNGDIYVLQNDGE